MISDLGAVRAELPCLGRETYLNSGGTGPLPRVAARAVEWWLGRALERARGSAAAAEEHARELDELRAAAGRAVGAPAERIALTSNTTHGIGLALWGLDWRPGDEVITTALEHPGLAAHLGVLARRAGVRVRLVPEEEAVADLEGAVARLAGGRTRALALSHVTYSTGALLDVAGAARAARRAGAVTVVDGAQSVGAIPVDADELGVDAYAFPAHKWLLGPEGLGALWVAPEAMGAIDVTLAGYDSGTGHTAEGGFEPHPAARRYEASLPALGLVPAWRACLDWLEGLGWESIHERVAAGLEAAREALAGIEGVELVTPPGPQAGLLSFTAGTAEPRAACALLAERGVIVRWLERPACLRASIGFFCDASDLERLRLGVASLPGCYLPPS